MSAPPAGLAALATRPPKRAAPRFLGDDESDDDDGGDGNDYSSIAAQRARGITRPGTTTTADDVDRLFAQLDNEDEDDLDLPPPMRATTDGKDKTVLIDDNILGGVSGNRKTGDVGDRANDDKAKTKRQIKPRAKIDEARLLGDRGFKKLRESLKSYSIKGKGHEEEDLRRLMTVYQLWTHHMFPRAPFRETLTLVEAKCKTKAMKYELKIWKDEAKGIFRPKANEGTSDMDGENDNSVNHGVVVRPYGAGDTSQAGSPIASQAGPKRSYFDDIPTSSPGGGLERDAEMRSFAGSDDEDLGLPAPLSQVSNGEADIFFSDVRASRTQPSSRPVVSTSRQPDFDDADIGFDLDDDIDEDIDAEAELAMMEMEQDSRRPPPRLASNFAAANPILNKPAPTNDFDDFDFGDEEDIMREMDALDALPAAKPTSIAAPTSVVASRTVSTSSRPELDFDDDDMLLEDDDELLKSIDEIEARVMQAKPAVRQSPAKDVPPLAEDRPLVDEDDEDLYA